MHKYTCCLLLIFSLPAFAIKNDEARYVGGTASNIKIGAVCRLNLSSTESLIVESSGQRLTISYANIESFQYTQEARWHLGVLPAIAIGLVKHWPRQHFFKITFRDKNDVLQVVIFEVPKSEPRGLQAALEVRVPRSCAVAPRCGTRNSALSCSNMPLAYAF